MDRVTANTNNLEKKRIENLFKAKQYIIEYAKSLELKVVLLVPIAPSKGVVWYDENGFDIDKSDIEKGAKIKTTKEILIPRLILATKKEQFKYIYSKMFKASNLEDNPFNHAIFQNEFPQLLEKLITNYKALNVDVQTYPTLSAARQLQAYVVSLKDKSMQRHQQNTKINKTIPSKFEDIFAASDTIHKYIDVLAQIEPPLLSNNRNFIGKPRGHKGVICGWIWELRNHSIIRQDINRKELAYVLNNEIQNFNMGKDGKTISNHSELYEKDFKKQLFSLTSMR